MEKILLIINAHKPNLGSIDFACRMAALAQTKLTGLLIENIYEPTTPSGYKNDSYFDAFDDIEPGTLVKTDTDQATDLFVQECKRNKIANEIFVDKGDPLDEVILESRFADLIIIDPDMDFYNEEDEVPSPFVKEILIRSECPVLLSPQKLEDIQEIVFCYDGGSSSVFAIKQFTYLLPEFSNKNALLLEINKTSEEGFNETHPRMMEWLKAHYQSASYHPLKGEVKDELFNYFFMKTNKLVVMGAYGRSFLSNLFKNSKADLLIRTVDLPLFITHY